MLVVIVVGEDLFDLSEDAVAFLAHRRAVARRRLEYAVFVRGATRRD